MKKIIGLALALAAAALVFVGCSEDGGAGDTDGGKWDLTMTVDGTDAAKTPLTANNRRYFKQLGTRLGDNSVAGITTTITIKKDGLTAIEDSKKGQTAVVGLMFDFNKNADGDAARDFGIIGINFDREVNTTTGRQRKAQYYVSKYTNVPLQTTDIFDTDDQAFDLDKDSKKKPNITCVDLSQTSNDVWQNLPTDSWKTVNHDFDGKGNAVEAYQIVVSIRPTITGTSGIGYEIWLGKDASNLEKLDLATPYTDARSTNKVTVKVGNADYELLCGGVAVYANVKKDTIAVANYKTERPSLGSAKKFDSLADLNKSSLVGDLKLTNTSDGNITVVVE